jgi:tetratricopeptide (TPR) repeat protein
MRARNESRSVHNVIAASSQKLRSILHASRPHQRNERSQQLTPGASEQEAECAPAQVSFGHENRFDGSNVVANVAVAGDLQQQTTVNNYAGPRTTVNIFGAPLWLVIIVMTFGIGMLAAFVQRQATQSPLPELFPFSAATSKRLFEFPPAAPGETLVIIARLPGEDNAPDLNTPAELIDSINKTAKLVGVQVRVETATIALGQEDSAVAWRLGQHYGASIVIWGVVRDYHVRIQFLDLVNPGHLGEIKVDELERVPANTERYISFVNRDMPNFFDFLVHFSVAISLYNDGKYPEANGLLDQVIADTDILNTNITPAGFDLTEIYFWKGWLEYIVTDLPSAGIRWYDRAIAARPKYWEAYYNRAFLLLADGDLIRAADDLHTVIAAPAVTENMRAWAYNQLGYIEVEREDWPAAQAALAQGLAITDTIGELHKNMALALTQEGRFKREPALGQAQRHLERALEVGLSTPRAEAQTRSLLGEIYALHGDQPGACAQLAALSTLADPRIDFYIDRLDSALAGNDIDCP